MKRASLLGALLVLAGPATAQAGTTTVDAGSGGGCQAQGTCKSISQALGVSKNGDTILVKKGTYVEDVAVPEDKGGITVKGEPGTVLRGTFTTAAADIGIAGLTVYPTTGGSAITAAGKITLTDVSVVAPGTALTLNGGADSRIQRSTLVSTNTSSNTADGVKQGAAGLTVDSSIVLGGARGAAFRVTTSNGSANAALTLNHVTTVMPGTGIGIVLLGTSASEGIQLNKVGDITLKVASSIIHGASGAAGDKGLLAPITNTPLRAPNAVTASFANSDASKFVGADGQPVAGTGGTTPNSALFSSATGMRLKFGAPVIDKGGALGAGESTTDIDGDPRTAGPATDIGADEFLNHAPTLTLSVLPEGPHTGEKVTASGRAVDREGGSDIEGFGTDWGDGSERTVSATGVVEHVYSKPGAYHVSMIVRDRSGEWSNLAQQTVTVLDADAPRLQLTAPAAGTTVRLNSDSGHKRLTIRGVASDSTGLANVEVALTKRGKKNKCLQYVGNTFGKGSCRSYQFQPATLAGGAFSLRTQKGVVIPTGTYQVRVRATDVAGNATSGFSKAAGTLVKFRVR